MVKINDMQQAVLALVSPGAPRCSLQQFIEGLQDELLVAEVKQQVVALDLQASG
jgi:hypothetical protein